MKIWLSTFPDNFTYNNKQNNIKLDEILPKEKVVNQKVQSNLEDAQNFL